MQVFRHYHHRYQREWMRFLYLVQRLPQLLDVSHEEVRVPIGKIHGKEVAATSDKSSPITHYVFTSLWNVGLPSSAQPTLAKHGYLQATALS